MGDSLEALIGATYLDKGYQYCEQYILDVLIAQYMDMESIKEQESNYKGRLIEFCQQHRKGITFEVAEEKRNKHNSFFVIHAIIEDELVGVGKDFSKKIATQMAAEDAYFKLVAPKAKS